MRLTLVVFAISLYSLEVSGWCYTPSFKRGDCISIRSCKVIWDAIQTRNEDAVFFAKKSQCAPSQRNQYPKVCCGPDKILKTTVFQHRLLPKASVCGQDVFGDVYVHDTGISAVGLGYGGKETNFRQHPWVALLKYLENGRESRRPFRCGGSLINRRYVLTAAHCTKLPSNSKLRLVGVRLGEHKISTTVDCEVNGYTQQCNDPVVNLKIEKIINHPNYSSKIKNHDISLIRLERTVQFTTYIRPICLPSKSTVIDTRLSLVGWGETEFSDFSDVKIEVPLPFVNSSECEFKLGRKIGDGQFCAGGEDHRDSCVGDSGGPLVSKNNKGRFDQYIQHGIVSFGLRDCGIIGVPGVYTRVSKYVDWIASNLAN